MTNKDLAIPTIHISGTSRETLIEGYLETRNHIRAALNSLGKHAPHARDYYPQGDGIFEAAKQQHHDRVQRLALIYIELGDICEAIQE